MSIVLHTRASPEFIRQVEAVFGPGTVTIVDEADHDGITSFLARAAYNAQIRPNITAPNPPIAAMTIGNGVHGVGTKNAAMTATTAMTARQIVPHRRVAMPMPSVR